MGDRGREFAGCRHLVKPPTFRSRIPTFRQSRTKKTGNLLDQGVRSDESIILSRQLLDQLLVLVQLLQIVRAHRIHPMMLSPIDIMLVSEDADTHVWARHTGQFDSAGETLVALGVIVLQADLELDGFEKVAFLLVQGVFEEGLHVGTHSGFGDIGLIVKDLRGSFG